MWHLLQKCCIMLCFVHLSYKYFVPAKTRTQSCQHLHVTRGAIKYLTLKECKIWFCVKLFQALWNKVKQWTYFFSYHSIYFNIRYYNIWIRGSFFPLGTCRNINSPFEWARSKLLVNGSGGFVWFPDTWEPLLKWGLHRCLLGCERSDQRSERVKSPTKKSLYLVFLGKERKAGVCIYPCVLHNSNGVLNLNLTFNLSFNDSL